MGRWPLLIRRPGEQTIAILAGVSDKIAREGIRGLREFPGFKWDYYLSQRGKRAKKYMLELPSSNNRGSAFPFFKFVLEAGIWREMKPSAKALYPVMRCFGFFDIHIYAELENDLEISINDFDEVYSQREYDLCDAELSIMAEHAGLHRNSITVALNELKQNFMIEPLTDSHGWKVFLKSRDSIIWTRDYLNRKVRASYMHKL
jgi:hypothetical protein